MPFSSLYIYCLCSMDNRRGLRENSGCHRAKCLNRCSYPMSTYYVRNVQTHNATHSWHLSPLPFFRSCTGMLTSSYWFSTPFLVDSMNQRQIPCLCNNTCVLLCQQKNELHRLGFSLLPEDFVYLQCSPIQLRNYVVAVAGKSPEAWCQLRWCLQPSDLSGFIWDWPVHGPVSACLAVTPAV